MITREPLIEPGFETPYAVLGLVITSFLLMVIAFAPYELSQSRASHMAVGGLTVFSGLFWLLSAFTIFDSMRHKPEKIRVTLPDGTGQLAEVYGLSKIPVGHAIKTKVRFYLHNGEAAWADGDGYKIQKVQRSYNGYKIL